MNTNELTPKQNKIFKFIQSYIDDFHVPPSLREIGKNFGVSVGTIQDQVEAIRRKGFLEKEGMIARGIKVAMGVQQIPILGRVHAGPLHLASENVEGYLPVGALYAPSKHFALKVRGDSMINAGIMDGDIAIVRSQPVAQDGDVVVARIEDETTVKHFKNRDGRIVLEPANPLYQPIKDTPFDVVGVVVEVRRQYKK